MARLRILPGVLALLLDLTAPTWAAPPAVAERAEARKLAATIDRLIAARLGANGIRPARLADDAVLLRRLALDLRGRIPPVAEARRHLADPVSDKHERAVERLLDSPGYATHFTNVWTDLLL
ncbi:MAG TPA: DUF1549 domain-containing protein, partial [Gemmataceae bacterium]|nr:DUF1549 domain-containing protein [Gemmataceae bacterium]